MNLIIATPALQCPISGTTPGLAPDPLLRMEGDLLGWFTAHRRNAGPWCGTAEQCLQTVTQRGNADILLIAVKELSISQRKETLILPSKYPVSSLPQCAARLLMCASGLQNWGCFCWKTGPSSVSCHQDMKLYLCASAIRWKHIHKHPEIIHHWAMMHIYPDAWQSFYYLSISCSQNLTFSLKIQRQYFWCYCFVLWEAWTVPIPFMGFEL